MKLFNVSYKYELNSPFENQALKNISFETTGGDFIGVTGLTGSGKSTLAKIVKGLLVPTEGRIENDFSSTGLVFQYPEDQIFDETVIKDVMFGPLNQGHEKEQAERIAETALAKVGLDSSYFERNPLLLSGGEKRRVAIAGILAMKPEVLILDEPAAGLDPENHDKLFKILQSFSDEGRTVLLISHDMNDIARFCNKVLFLDHGSISFWGKTENCSICKTEESLILDKLKSLNLV